MSEVRSDEQAKEVKLVQKTMVSISNYTRRWDTLQRLENRLDDNGVLIAAVGSTLELEPGESALVLVPDDFEDPWLKEAKVGAPKKAAPTKTEKEG